MTDEIELDNKPLFSLFTIMNAADDSAPSIANLIRRACDRAGGSQRELAKRTGFTQQAISKAIKANSVTARLAKAIHDATDGEIPKWKLRPDLYDPPPLPTPIINQEAPHG